MYCEHTAGTSHLKYKQYALPVYEVISLDKFM